MDSHRIFLVRSCRPTCTVILPNLLIGEYPAPDDADWLRSAHQVTTVFSLQDDSDLASKCLDLHHLQHAYRQHGLRFQRMPVPDCDLETFAQLLDGIVGALTELLRAGERVYLHCNAGMNRAPTVAIAYLHTAHGLPLASARDFVKQRHHCVPYMRLLQLRYEGAE
ncbi:MAG: dual specificity protein phosphatase family protein [Candidatus Binatia bacterium]